MVVYMLQCMSSTFNEKRPVEAQTYPVELNQGGNTAATSQVRTRHQVKIDLVELAGWTCSVVNRHALFSEMGCMCRPKSPISNISDSTREREEIRLTADDTSVTWEGELLKFVLESRSMNYDIANPQLSKEHANNGVISTLGRKEKEKDKGEDVQDKRLLRGKRDVCMQITAQYNASHPTHPQPCNEPAIKTRGKQYSTKTKTREKEETKILPLNSHRPRAL